MKVLVISHMYPSTADTVRGVFVHEQVASLRGMGVDVRVVSPKPWIPWLMKHMSGKWKAITKVPRYVEQEGIRVYYPRYIVLPRRWGFLYSGQCMFRGLRRTVDAIHTEFPFDLVHAHVALPDGYAAMLLARRFCKPFVVTIHGADAYVTARSDGRCAEAIREVLEAAGQTVLVSGRLKQVLQESVNTDRASLRIIHNGVSLGKACSGPPENPEEGSRLLSLGYLIERKGHRYVLEAIAHLVQKHPHVLYEIAGTGPLREELEREAERLGIESNVRFIGFVPDNDLPRLLASCNAFVLPSWNEAFGIVYLEAMLNGKPVIGCQGEGVEEFVRHGDTGLLVKPRDVESLVEALDFLLGHPEEARVMGERARRLVLENYTWEKNAEKTAEVYREVLNARTKANAVLSP